MLLRRLVVRGAVPGHCPHLYDSFREQIARLDSPADLKRWSMAKAIYQIRIKGYLRPGWSEWFGGMTITHESNGDTILSGLVRDQAALHGLLTRVRDLGLTLVSVNQFKSTPKSGG